MSFGRILNNQEITFICTACVTNCNRRVRKVESEINDSGPRTEYGIVRVPRVILDRVEPLYAAKGYTSVSEYIRVAILKQLASDEAVP